MRNLLEYPITTDEVIEFLENTIEIENILEQSTNSYVSADPACAKIALAVVKAASIIIQNDIGSTAADLLAQAFQSQNIRVKEVA